MKLPTWVIGENLEEKEPVDSYIVRLVPPRIGAKVTQKRGFKLMLTVRAPAEHHEKEWYRLLHQGARFWAQDDPAERAAVAHHPPEIQVNEAFELPRLLICDNASLDRTFIVHTRPHTLFVAEIQSTIPDLPAEHPRLCNAQGQWLVVHGDFPVGAEPILKEVATLLGW